MSVTDQRCDKWQLQGMINLGSHLAGHQLICHVMHVVDLQCVLAAPGHQDDCRQAEHVCPQSHFTMMLATCQSCIASCCWAFAQATTEQQSVECRPESQPVLIHLPRCRGGCSGLLCVAGGRVGGPLHGSLQCHPAVEHLPGV